MSEDTIPDKNFLKIKSIRTSSNAFLMNLKEDDIIISLDGELYNGSYDDLSKVLADLKEKKYLHYIEMEFFLTPLLIIHWVSSVKRLTNILYLI